MVNGHTEKSQKDGTVDRWGAVASTTCAVHCAVCALVPAALATLGLDFLIGHTAEWTFTIIAVFFGLCAIALSWRSHRNLIILAALSLGVIGLLSARVLEGGSHHGHHGGEHHDSKTEVGHKASGEHHEKHEAATPEKHAENDAHHEEGDDGHDEHEGGHLAIEMLSVLAGATLVFGHLGNLALLRRKMRATA